MNLQPEKLTDYTDFRRKSTQALAIAALLILTPFSINNFFHERYVLGAGSLAIVAILAFNCWSISRGRYSSLFLLFGLIPAIIFFLILAIRQQGMVGILWCYPAVVSFYMMLPERKAWLANIAFLGIILPQVWFVIEPSLAARVTATFLGVSIFSIIFVRVITAQQNRLHALVIRDPLTGLFNRTLLLDSLEQAIQQHGRTATPMTLLTIDIDHFKMINDTLGHDAGDKVLHEVGELFLSRVRSIDKVFRQGGEEFLVLLFGTDAENGRRVAEDLRREIASLKLPAGHSVTASIGIATLQPGEGPTAWMKRSDDNLYRAKLDGRNRVAT